MPEPTWAPASSSIWTHFGWAWMQASCRGVKLSTDTILTDAPASISCFNCRARPRDAASCTGVRSAQWPTNAVSYFVLSGNRSNEKYIATVYYTATLSNCKDRSRFNIKCIEILTDVTIKRWSGSGEFHNLFNLLDI